VFKTQNDVMMKNGNTGKSQCGIPVSVRINPYNH